MADKLREEIKKLHAYKRAPLISQQKFEWLISPTPVDEFFDTYWELKPLVRFFSLGKINNNKPKYSKY